MPARNSQRAEWCSPCLVLAKVDADENMRIAGRHKVRGFPTVIAYSRGQEAGRFHSAQPEHFLRRFIDKLVERHTAASNSLMSCTSSSAC